MFANLFTAILAVCLASFTNLCAARLGVAGESPWSPARSYCPHCRHPLCWWQLIPILGFILQGGHCHFCRRRIPIYDTACELAGGLFTGLLATPSLFHSFLVVVVIQALLFIASCDYYYQCLYPLSLVGLFSLPLIIPAWSPPTSATWIVSLLVLVLLISMVYQHWLGSGDVIFMAILLVSFGLEYTAAIILCACLLSLPFFACHHQKQLPFLPPICLSTAIGLALICA